MTALDVAVKDFSDAVRSRALWIASGIFLVLMVLVVSLVVWVFSNPDPRLASTFLNGPATDAVLPIIGLVIGYKAIVGERETGNVKFLLGLPHSRRDIVIGKFLGRFAVLSVAIVIGFAAAAAIIVAVLGVPPVVPMVSYLLFVLLGGAAVVATAVGVSAVVSTPSRAIAAVVGGYIFATTLWSIVPSGLHYVVNGELPRPDAPLWVEVVDHLNPLVAISAGGSALLPNDSKIEVLVTESGITASETGPAPDSAVDSLVNEPIFLVGILLLWTVLPLAVGYLRFKGTDLS